jgi:hypothetical protein
MVCAGAIAGERDIGATCPVAVVLTTKTMKPMKLESSRAISFLPLVPAEAETQMHLAQPGQY